MASEISSLLEPQLDRYHCSCYFTHNIFVHRYKVHVTYFKDDPRFLKEHEEILAKKGCTNEDSLQEVLEDVKTEVLRRECIGRKHVRRRILILGHYRKLHPSVYTLNEDFFEPKFLEIVKYCQGPDSRVEGLLDLINEENAPNVFSFPVFTRYFCTEFISEMVRFENSDLPKGRPNTMNKGGILLSELGFDKDFFDPLREKYLMPIARLLYPQWVSDGLDSHRAFVVKYAMGEDLDLSYHYDNAEVTLNVCLGAGFEGGSLYFGAMRMEAAHTYHNYSHVIGRGLLHRAQHMHGANPISSGERYNLIIWMRSSSVRNKLCPMCNNPPQLVPTEGPGDGFTKLSNDNPPRLVPTEAPGDELTKLSDNKSICVPS